MNLTSRSSWSLRGFVSTVSDFSRYDPLSLRFGNSVTSSLIVALPNTVLAAKARGVTTRSLRSSVPEAVNSVTSKPNPTSAIAFQSSVSENQYPTPVEGVNRQSTLAKRSCSPSSL